MLRIKVNGSNTITGGKVEKKYRSVFLFIFNALRTQRNFDVQHSQELHQKRAKWQFLFKDKYGHRCKIVQTNTNDN